MRGLEARRDEIGRNAVKLDLSHAGIVRLVAGGIAVVMTLWHLWVIAFGAPEAMTFRGLHLLLAAVLIFLWFRRSGTAEGAPSVLDYVLLVLIAAPILYILGSYEYITTRIAYIDDPLVSDYVLGILLMVLILEATRRIIGWALPLTAIVFVAYALLIAKVEPARFIDQMFLTTEGIFGIPLSVSASYVVVFVVFGAFMERTGTGQLFMDFAMALTGHTAGGPGKVSVVSSSLFGTISGSAVANVMVDGPISIPLMKRTGFRPEFAAGVEAVASTGGQIMPPIMGAAAFVMAEFLQVGYGQVIVWALIPSILYYVACFCAVHFEARRRGIHGVPRAELPVMRNVIRERGHLFIPILTILGVMYSGYSAPMAALWGTIACFPVAALRASTRENVTLANVVDALIDGAKNALAVALACACAGIIIGIVTLTGIGLTFTQAVVGLANETLLLALVLTAIAGIVLGMGMPTTPAYIIMTSLLVPAIVKLGVAAPAAHMFAFYFAILSAITPPVALAVFAAAGLAKADLWRSGWAAMRIGCAGFVVPFMFVYEPALMMLDPAVTKSKDFVTAAPMHIVWTTFTATTGIAFLAAGLAGYLAATATMVERVMLIAACFFLVNPNGLAALWGTKLPPFALTVLTDGIGFGIGAIVLAIHMVRRKQEVRTRSIATP